MRNRWFNHRRNGFLAADVLLGLMLLGVLATVLAMALNMRSQAALRLAEQRTALQTAEHVLMGLATDGRTPATDPEMTVQVTRRGERLGEYEWVDVTVIHGRHRASLVGLARPTTQPGGAP
jgi:type II secretory pathway pseudopilin PulG